LPPLAVHVPAIDGQPSPDRVNAACPDPNFGWLDRDWFLLYDEK
jgi:hypothetical protein